MKKIILVTGGAGFVGSHLCETLAKDKNNIVISYDNYFTGSIQNHVENVIYISGDTRDIQHRLDYLTPDLIYHLGEYSRVEQSFEDMDIVLEYNKKGTFSVLEYTRKKGSKLVYAGSSTKFAETHDYLISPYAWSKKSNTELVINYGKWFDLNYAITYFYNVYGPREIENGKYATVIAKFKDLKKRNEDLTVVSPGSQIRNFTHVDDIVSGLLLVGEKGRGDEYGIGSDKSYTILEVAKMFGGHIKMLPERKGNRMSAQVVTEKTKALGWKETKNLEDYIKSEIV